MASRPLWRAPQQQGPPLTVAYLSELFFLLL